MTIELIRENIEGNQVRTSSDLGCLVHKPRSAEEEVQPFHSDLSISELAPRLGRIVLVTDDATHHIFIRTAERLKQLGFNVSYIRMF